MSEHVVERPSPTADSSFEQGPSGTSTFAHPVRLADTLATDTVADGLVQPEQHCLPLLPMTVHDV